MVYPKLYCGYLLEHFSYQQSSYKVYNELLSPECNEFYFIDNSNFYLNFSLLELKNAFFSINSILIGFLMNDNKVNLKLKSSIEISQVHKFIVIAKGTE